MVDVDMRKWPDQPHWQFQAAHLGEDEYGSWLVVQPGTLARRGNEPERPIRSGFVALVPSGSWWIVEFDLHPSRYELSVNIGSPPEWHDDRVRQIDLDLDVVRTAAGEVVILDEDEFDDHRVRFDYPRAVVDAAREATELASRMVADGAEPFAGAPRRWLDLARTGEPLR